jgi:hypothetical protein
MGSRNNDPLHAWLECAAADAERRGLTDLKPLLESLGRQLAALRAADWNDHAGGAQEMDAPGSGDRQ